MALPPLPRGFFLEPGEGFVPLSAGEVVPEHYYVGTTLPRLPATLRRLDVPFPDVYWFNTGINKVLKAEGVSEDIFPTRLVTIDWKDCNIPKYVIDDNKNVIGKIIRLTDTTVFDNIPTENPPGRAASVSSKVSFSDALKLVRQRLKGR